MKANLMVLVGLALTFIAARGEASVRVGNGGDVVECEAKSGAAFTGIYSFDYLASYDAYSNNADIHPVTSWKESAERIHNFLGLYVPKMQASWDGFVQSVGNFTDKNASRLWQLRPGKLVDVRNLEATYHFPDNCRVIQQAVIRNQRGTQIIYDTDLGVLDQLKDSPLQMSFLMFHEFLWDYELNDQERLELNRFVHSNAMESWSARDVVRHLSAVSRVTDSMVAERRSHFMGTLLDLIAQTVSKEEIVSQLSRVYESRLPTFMTKGFGSRLTTMTKHFRGFALLEELEAVTPIDLMLLAGRDDAALAILEAGFTTEREDLASLLAGSRSPELGAALVKSGQPSFSTAVLHLRDNELLGDVVFVLDDPALYRAIRKQGVKAQELRWVVALREKANKTMAAALAAGDDFLNGPVGGGCYPFDRKCGLTDVSESLFHADYLALTVSPLWWYIITQWMDSRERPILLRTLFSVPGATKAMRSARLPVEYMSVSRSQWGVLMYKVERKSTMSALEALQTMGQNQGDAGSMARYAQQFL